MSLTYSNQTTSLDQAFIHFAIAADVLSFGQFQTKAGRLSPYYFNAGKFYDGYSLRQLAQFYAKKLTASALRYDMLFGPAYKGIVLASATAVGLAEQGLNIPFAFNRKEVKNHGEGGQLIGAPLKGRVLIIDDVISAGISINESIDIIHSAGATPAGVLIAIDRMEKSGTATDIGDLSAVEEVARRHKIPVLAIATLQNLLDYLAHTEDRRLQEYLPMVQAYRARYGS
jgi:orotate phosphoribosyltransferase